MLSADGISVTREAVDEMVAACDMGVPTPVNLDTLFTKEPFCTVSHFEEWVKTHPNLSSFTRWVWLCEVRGNLEVYVTLKHVGLEMK